FFFSRSARHHALPSFPPRRSSDLTGQDMNQRADAVEHAMAEALAPVAVKSMIYTSGEEDPTAPRPPMSVPGRVMLMDQDPRLKRSEEHTSELQSRSDLVCRLLLEK